MKKTIIDELIDELINTPGIIRTCVPCCYRKFRVFENTSRLIIA